MSSQAVKKSYWSVSVCIRSSSHTPVCFTPKATGNLAGGGKRRRGGGGRATISPAQSALSGLAVTAGGQARSSPNLSLSLLMSLSLLLSCQYLWQGIISSHLLLNVFLGVAKKQNGIFAPWSYRFLTFFGKRKKGMEKDKKEQMWTIPLTYFSCVSVLHPSGLNMKLGPAVSVRMSHCFWELFLSVAHSLSESQKRLHLTRKKDPLFFSCLCKRSLTYLAFSEQPL